MTGLPWDASYHDGPAPWISPAAATNSAFGIRRRFAGAVLDAGLRNRREHSSHRRAGIVGLGVDVAETALAIAKKKADDRGIEVEFAAADAFELQRLGRRLKRCWTADSSTVSTATSDSVRGESSVGDRARWNPICVVLQ